jgi:glutamate synthase (NADPH) large chain
MPPVAHSQHPTIIGRDQISRPDIRLHREDRQERDACALICSVRKGGTPTHGNVKRTIEALARMGHRTGYINGEGDGVGIMTDIPRQLWSRWLGEAGLIASLATDRNFWVAHVMIRAQNSDEARPIAESICRVVSEEGLHVLIDRPGHVDSRVLGPNAEANEPVFWQIAGINGQVAPEKLEQKLFELQVRLETELGVHFASFSSHSVVYKVQGTIEILRRYYPELRHPEYASAITMGHARYSTNTNPIFERAQPFNLIGHNGEFNTISRFRMEAQMLGVPLLSDGSDSQDVDRMVHALCTRYGMDLIEAIEHVFPPYAHDLPTNVREIHDMYGEMRQAFGHFAQGPAAVAARFGDTCVFSVDALGLRPLWYGETEKDFFASSERGVYPLDSLAMSPRPLAPGEKVALRVRPGHKNVVEVLDYPAIQRHVFRRYQERHPNYSMSSPIWSLGDMNHSGLNVPKAPLTFGHDATPHANGHDNGHDDSNAGGNGNGLAFERQAAQVALAEQPTNGLQAATGAMQPQLQMQNGHSITPTVITSPWQDNSPKINAAAMSAFGWERYHLGLVEALVEKGKELIGSLGWDGPLAAMSNTRTNLADYFKETVAVVTNPAIDREREQSQFSTQMLVGARPAIGAQRNPNDTLVSLDTPLLLGGHADIGKPEILDRIASEKGTMTVERLLATFGERAAILSMSAHADETIDAAIARLQEEAVRLVRGGVQCIVLDDAAVLDGERLWLDPLLVTAAVDKALRTMPDPINLRRRTGLVVRSGALRDLHDLALCVSLGANAIVPYALYAVAVGIAPKGGSNLPDDEFVLGALSNTLTALTNGLQKVISTIGCHELRGYGHSFSSIGLSTDVAELFGMPNYFGSDARGLTFTALRQDAENRAAELRGETRARLSNPDRFNPKFWKKAEAVALGEGTIEEMNAALDKLEAKTPVSIRHLIGFHESAADAQRIDPADVDLSIKDHDMPMIISAMSFGSQGELSYKAYAEAAYKLNTICINGEGGEMSDVMGKYPRNRGQQVASARFGVNIGLLNSCDIIEIKIGQGAKPGEGGQLPGFKVTAQIAEVRSTTPGVPLISPSNNHDLYSIEDLAQLIDELKTANDRARVSVKLPVVPGIGIIAVGVAKAGADVITLTGYTGGTGAARAHALRHVGLPAEVGVWLAHHALVQSGLRRDVEIWVDGGMKSARDVLKMVCLGANRVGFGSLPMMAVGCTICRGCHDGTCHVGITTHVKTKDEADERGFKAFRPFEERGSADGIVNLFRAMADDLRCLTAKLGATNLQELVGRADLLQQVALQDRIDLDVLLKPVPVITPRSAQPGGRRVSRPRNIISKQITDVIQDYVSRGDTELTYDDEQVMAMDRALGTHLCGALKRGDVPGSEALEAVNLSFSSSAVPGNGLGAFIDEPVHILVEGGAQDGVAKCASGGTVTVLKGLNHNGARLDGSVGKSFAYGAQKGLFIVQGNADTRACIRMSGADVVFGGEVRECLQDDLGNIGTRANLKGYAFEYMTSGRAVVLGDPGPWICAGMTGGVIYQRIQREMNLTVDAIKRRIAPGSLVDIMPLDEKGQADVRELLGKYISVLQANDQADKARQLDMLWQHPDHHFVKIAPPTTAN